MDQCRLPRRAIKEYNGKAMDMLSKLSAIATATLVVVMLLSACQSGKEIGNEVTTESGSYWAVSAEELQTMLANNQFHLSTQ